MLIVYQICGIFRSWLSCNGLECEPILELAREAGLLSMKVQGLHPGWNFSAESRNSQGGKEFESGVVAVLESSLGAPSNRPYCLSLY